MVNYSAGEIISSGVPLAHVLNEDRKSQLCDQCCLSDKKLKKCANCKHMYYCDATCQKTDWKWHKYECKIYSKYYDRLSHNLERFLLRLYLYLKSNPDQIMEKKALRKDASKERCYENLMTHHDDISSDSKKAHYFDVICERYNQCNIDIDRKLLFEHFCKICVNSYSILNVDLNEVGSGLYVVESMFNHSCAPNASTVFHGNYLELHAIKDIGSDEEITINYIDLKESKQLRQQKLQQQYYFECMCPKCQHNLDHDIDYDLLNDLIKQMDQRIPGNSQNDWLQAFQIGLRTLPFYNRIYGEYHPDKTVQLFRLLKLRLLLNDEPDSSEDLKEVMNVIFETEYHITITHGQEHPLYSLFTKLIKPDEG